MFSFGGGGGAQENEEEDQQETGNSENSKASLALFDKLYNNYNVFFDKLELGDEVVGCDYILLLRALCHNTTVRHVTIGSNFLGNLNTDDEIRIVLEVIASMPKLETLRIHYFPEMPLHARSVANILKRTKYLKELHFFDLELAGDDYDLEPLGEALENLATLKNVSFYRLGLEEREDDHAESIFPFWKSFSLPHGESWNGQMIPWVAFAKARH